MALPVRFDRRWLAAALLVPPLAVASYFAWNWYFQPIDERWARSIERASVVVRTINPRDEDFSDLAPLAEWIGNRRFVLMTEPHQAAGATFDARSRLIRFLHQELGFNVVALDWPALEMNQIDQALDDADWHPSLGSDHPRSHPLVTQRSVFDYIHGTRVQGERPMHVMGFQSMYSDPAQVLDECRALMDSGDSPLDASELAELSRMIETFRMESPAGSKPGDEDISRMKDLSGQMLEYIDQHFDALAQRHGGDKVGVMESIVWTLPTVLEMYQLDPPYEWRRHDRRLEARDQAMARFVLDAAERRFPEGKFILMGDTYHLVSQSELLRIRTMADFLAERLEGQMYTITFEAYSGQVGIGESWYALHTAPRGSLAELMQRGGQPFRLLDLTRLPADHWLRQTPLRPNSMSVARLIVWPDICDAVFYIHEERPVMPDTVPGQ